MRRVGIYALSSALAVWASVSKSAPLYPYRGIIERERERSGRALHIYQVRYIIVHCSASPENVRYSAEQLTRDHLARGFEGSGYHFYVLRTGEVVPLRPLDRVGAHARGYNRCSVGVCYEGGLDAQGRPKDTRTPAQKSALIRLLLYLKTIYPDAQIRGHRDMSKDRNRDGVISPSEWMKACPCFDAVQEYAPLLSDGACSDKVRQGH